MQLLKLVRNRVAIGEPLPWNVRDGNRKLLLASGHVITDEAQLETLLERGAFVDAEEVKAAAARAAAAAATAAQVTIFDEWNHVISKLGRLLKGVATEPGFSENIGALAHEIFVLVERDTDIGIFLTVRQDLVRLPMYGLTHATHTAMLCVLLGKRLGWEPGRILSLASAALTMNVSIIALQGRLATQGSNISDAQKALLREHPTAGAAMLRAAGVVDEDWLATVAHHHERPDGSGYPAGTPQDAELVRALRHADVFMAKISHRTARPAMTVQEAERQLYRDDAGGPMAMAIIKEFGIYPPGDFVQLKSGEQAVVVKRSGNASTPIASAVTDRSGVPMVNTIRRDTALPEFAIVAPIADKSLAARVPPERLYGVRS